MSNTSKVTLHMVSSLGHSQRATFTLLVAAKYPQLFSELILIELASVTKFQQIRAPVN